MQGGSGNDTPYNCGLTKGVRRSDGANSSLQRITFGSH